MNYAQLIQLQAKQVFGKKEKANTWLNQLKASLSGHPPIELARRKVSL
ncbi:protein of unknown function DUF2384 [Pseudomonas sp. GM30]|nr:antitoxin Xre/MbcA/ParS toxin-binding domain-containing protein [Pseudomonas sp. GM30]EUB87004.1 protein of unknown function DUF2384 [Pseudomonas sp. GM30]